MDRVEDWVTGNGVCAIYMYYSLAFLNCHEASLRIPRTSGWKMKINVTLIKAFKDLLASLFPFFVVLLTFGVRARSGGFLVRFNSELSWPSNWRQLWQEVGELLPLSALDRTDLTSLSLTGLYNLFLTWQHGAENALQLQIKLCNYLGIPLAKLEAI